MADLIALRTRLSTLANDVARNTSTVESAKLAIAGLTSVVSDLTDKIAALQAAGGGASQADLDALAKQAADIDTAVNAATDSLAAAIPANTTAAAPAPATPGPSSSGAPEPTTEPTAQPDPAAAPLA